MTVGLPAPDARASVSPLTLTAEARTVVGSYLGSAVPARDIPLYVDLWRSGRLPLERLVSSRITLHDLDVAMDRLAAGGELRQLIVLDERTTLVTRTALVTGAARGIGAATALRLAADGYQVAVLDLREEDCAATVDAIRAGGRAADGLGADVGSTQDAVAAASRAWSRSSARRRCWSTTPASCATTCCSR